MNLNFKATVVFEDIWEALNEKTIVDGVPEHLYKLILEEGSSRSSKTWSNFQVLFLYHYTNPQTSASVLRDTQKSCRDIVEKDWKDWLSDPMLRKKQYEKGEITINQYDQYLKEESLKQYFIENKTNHTWTFKHNSNVIWFTGLDDEDLAMGMTQTICWINEPYKFGHDVYKQLAQRSKIIIADWNPKQKHWLEEEKKKQSTYVNYSTFLDNPFNLKETVNQLLSYQPVSFCKLVVDAVLTEQQAKQYNCETNESNFDAKLIKELLRCQYNESVNSADSYMWSVFGLGLKAEKPNRIHKNWIKISDAEFDQLSASSYYGLDFGTTNPCSLVEVKYIAPRTFFTKQRLYKPSSQLESSLSSTLIAMGFTKKDLIVCDTGGQTDILSIAELNNAGLNAVPAIKGAGSVNQGINFINNSINYYTESSTDLEYEYENYEWEIINGVNLERPIKKDDHALNADRYIKTFLQFRYNIK